MYVVLPGGSLKHLKHTLLDGYCIIWLGLCTAAGCGMSHWLHISLVCCSADPYIGGKATWRPQSIAAALWSFPTGPEWRTPYLSSGPMPNLFQRKVMKKLIISNEELVIGPKEMTVSTTLRSPKGRGDWEVPNSSIHCEPADFLDLLRQTAEFKDISVFLSFTFLDYELGENEYCFKKIQFCPLADGRTRQYQEFFFFFFHSARPISMTELLTQKTYTCSKIWINTALLETHDTFHV